jgi:hypothetical protein
MEGRSNLNLVPCLACRFCDEDSSSEDLVVGTFKTARAQPLGVRDQPGHAVDWSVSAAASTARLCRRGKARRVTLIGGDGEGARGRLQCALVFARQCYRELSRCMGRVGIRLTVYFNL